MSSLLVNLPCLCPLFRADGGTPRGASWRDAMADCVVALQRARESSEFTLKQCVHLRGRFPTVSAGFVYGLGQSHSAMTTHEVPTGVAIAELIADANVRRIAGFQSSLLRAYAPRFWECYHTTMDSIVDMQP
ncbi:hypothetical protein BDN71DRAFT_830930 [Pleurotus eryngii]|uniref:Uncharacterized protein n=1 Tax=Pleurotus eryngii TaxID=5323 RepID=A0A9P6D8M2_PLEER|nr:hypothetical protein BDN71DRAFT_830930 [Pleurotus eryngii]